MSVIDHIENEVYRLIEDTYQVSMTTKQNSCSVRVC